MLVLWPNRNSRSETVNGLISYMGFKLMPTRPLKKRNKEKLMPTRPLKNEILCTDKLAPSILSKTNKKKRGE